LILSLIDLSEAISDLMSFDLRDERIPTTTKKVVVGECFATPNIHLDAGNDLNIFVQI